MTHKRILVGFLLAFLAFSTRAIAADAPNIVFAFADDLGRYASAYADPNAPSPNDVIHTPFFDRIAAEGTRFDCALVSAPSCTPSRAAIVSGQHFFRNGSHSQLHHPWMKGFDDPWDEVRGFPLMLQASGYHIGWSYKMHISEDRMGGKDRNYRKHGSRFNTFSQNVMRADDTEAGKQELLEEVRGNFRSFLADRNDKQPFYYWFNPTNTHRSWVQGSGKKIWGIEPDSLKGKLPPFLPDNEIVREDFADYLGEAQAFDAAVGILLEELTALGELENTIVVVSGDHGAPGFPRGKCNLYDFGTQVPLAIRWPKHVAEGRVIQSPVSLLDLAPTFLEAAGLQADERMDGQSLLAAMNAETRDPEEVLRGTAICGRENHVNESRPGGLPYPMRAIRTGEYLYIVNFAPDRWPVAQPPLAAPLTNPIGGKKGGSRRMDLDFSPTRDFFELNEGDETIAEWWRLGFDLRPAEELYVIADDPHQMLNVADDVNFAAVKSQLRGQLLAELNRGNDPRVIDDGKAFDRPPYAPDTPERGVPDIEALRKEDEKADVN
ncbi:MAG: sulfatase [Planctomycetaceae bacterium]|nr:sulfatase [Planctomycetaceae bacterium]